MGIGQVIAENERLRADLKEALRKQQKQAAELIQNERLRTDLEHKLVVLKAANDRLNQQLQLILKKQRGPKSERFDPSTMPLLPFEVPVPPPRAPLLGEGDDKPEQRKAAKLKRKARRRNPAEDNRFEHLPVRCRAESTAACPGCGGDLHIIGTTTSSRYEWQPGRFVVLDVERDKCACPTCPSQGVLTAPDPFALWRAICGNGLLARVLVGKFADHLPLNRLVKRMKREGLTFATSTLSGWVVQAAELLSVIVVAIERRLMEQPWLQGDDTGSDVQDGGNGKLRKGRLWAFTDQNEVMYRFTATKEAVEPGRILDGFAGEVLLVDAGSEFNKVVRELDLERAGCGAHLRRYFFEARDEQPVEVNLILQTLKAIFMNERDLHGESEERILASRQEVAKPLMDGMFSWLKDISPTLRPDSAFGKAVGYARNNESTFRVFLDHPKVPFHNNLSELQLRQPVVGRKNWLFFGSEGGAQAATAMYTLVGSCVMQGIDPQVYLTDVLGRLPFHPANRVSELTPMNWFPLKT